MKSGTRIGLAVGMGYVLGRRRKLRTALTLAAAVAAGRMSRDPAAVRKLGGALPGATQLSGLGRLGAPLLGAGRAAAAAATGSGIDALSGKLRGQADALRRKAGGGGGAQRDEPSTGARTSGNGGNRTSGNGSGDGRASGNGGGRAGGNGGNGGGRAGGNGDARTGGNAGGDARPGGGDASTGGSDSTGQRGW